MASSGDDENNRSGAGDLWQGKADAMDAVREFGASSVDFGKTAKDYATHRAGFPQSFFDGLAGFGFSPEGASCLDLGTGTGTIARGLAQMGATVSGVDPAAAMMEAAKELDAEAGVEISYSVGTAEETGVPDGSMDWVFAGQCWHWFDGAAAMEEVKRVLKPGGHLVIAHFDWIPIPGNVAAVTERLIEKHNPEWKMGGGNGLYPLWLTQAATAGFSDIRTATHDVFQPYTQEAWRGRIRASAGISAALSEQEVAAFDEELSAALSQAFGDPMAVHHRVFTLVAAAPVSPPE